MQFIEQLLGFSPDSGNGFTEIAILASALAGILLVWAQGTKERPKRI